MKTNRRAFLRSALVGLAAAPARFPGGLALAQAPELALRVAFVAPAGAQPAQRDKAVLFYDDFDQPPAAPGRYFEYSTANGSFAQAPGEGMRGGAMRCQFDKGQVSAGALHVLFGKNPFGRGIRPDETFREICWRVYVKHEPGWEGNPAKLARTTCLAGRDYSQGLIAHVWGGQGSALCIDPATGIRESRKVTTRYNDFANLKWLGARHAQTPLFSAAESGRWVCVESRVRLNTPGQKDGLFELWVDARLEAARTDLDWHGSWQEYGINAVYLENYWNQGSVKRQARWFDHFIVSTQPIGPLAASTAPELARTGPAKTAPWEVQAAADAQGSDIVWQSNPVDGARASLSVDAAGGSFCGSRAGQASLGAGKTHWLRIRPAGAAAWSPWHSPFAS